MLDIMRYNIDNFKDDFDDFARKALILDNLHNSDKDK